MNKQLSHQNVPNILKKKIEYSNKNIKDQFCCV